MKPGANTSLQGWKVSWRQPGEWIIFSCFALIWSPTKIWATWMSVKQRHFLEKQAASLKRTKCKGRQCRPTFITWPPNCTVDYWYETPTGNNSWKYKHVTEHSWEINCLEKKTLAIESNWILISMNNDWQELGSPWLAHLYNIYVTSELPSSFWGAVWVQ